MHRHSLPNRNVYRLSSHSLVAASRTTVMRLPGCINTGRLLVGANSRSQGAAGRRISPMAGVRRPRITRRSATCREPTTARNMAVASSLSEMATRGGACVMSASCWARRSAGRPGVVTAMVRDPASLTFAGAADWLAGRCGAWVWVWVCRPGGGRSWGRWPGVVARCRDRLAPASHSVL